MLKMKNGKLLLLKIEKEVVEKDGVIYTNEQKHKSTEGIVVGVPEDSGYKEGDHLIFSEFAGEEVWVDGKKHLIIDCENVWAIVGDDNEDC
jgi:chaperonin GroES